MNLIGCGYNVQHPSTFQLNETIEKNFGTRFRILLIKNDCYIQMNDYILNQTEKNTLVFVGSGTFLQCKSNVEHYTDDWIEFSAEVSEIKKYGLFENFIIPNLEQKDIEKFESILQLLEETLITQKAFFQECCNHYLQILLIEISKLSENGVHLIYANTNLALYKKISIIREQILSNISQNISIPEICEQNSISESHFRRSYKKIFNTTIQNDIIEKKVSLAQKLLIQEPQLSTIEIAEKIGYNNYEHFFRQFKKETGLTPKGYRNRFTKI